MYVQYNIVKKDFIIVYDELLGHNCLGKNDIILNVTNNEIILGNKTTYNWNQNVVLKNDEKYFVDKNLNKLSKNKIKNNTNGNYSYTSSDEINENKLDLREIIITLYQIRNQRQLYTYW